MGIKTKAFGITIILVIAIFIIIDIAVINTGTVTTSFDEYGVWRVLDNSSLAALQKKSAGPADVSRLERYINYHFYGVSADSLRIKFDVYGMMEYSKADTLKGVLISSSSQIVGDSTIVFADTLNAEEDYPYIFLRILNQDTDTAVSSVDAWVHARPIIKTVIQR